MNTEREHLDAEVVAAWIDGGLDAPSLAAAEAHASNCDRCQALLATVARTLPVEGVRDVKVAATSAATTSAEATSWFGSWRLWAPLAATAAAVTLWMVVPQDRMQAPARMSPESDVAQAPAAPGARVAPAAPSTQMSAPPEAAAKATPPPTSDARFAESRRAPERKDAGAKETFADAQTNKPDVDALRDRQEKREAATLQERVAAAPAAPPAAAAPAESARDTAAPGAALGAVAQSQLRKQAAPIEIVSPAPQRRWRVLPAVVEYSQDGGRTWVPVRLTAGDIITAGTSPAAQVCWIVGQQGLVLLATDGTNFTRLPFPERADLVAITATNARQATVTTADGRTFRTIDNGRNWRQE